MTQSPNPPTLSTTNVPARGVPVPSRAGLFSKIKSRVGLKDVALHSESNATPTLSTSFGRTFAYLVGNNNGVYRTVRVDRSGAIVTTGFPFDQCTVEEQKTGSIGGGSPATLTFTADYDWFDIGLISCWALLEFSVDGASFPFKRYSIANHVDTSGVTISNVQLPMKAKYIKITPIDTSLTWNGRAIGYKLP